MTAATAAADALRETPMERIAQFLRRFADRIEARTAEIVDMANAETALAKSPRLAEVELPRTTNQLRQAADAALEGSWALPTMRNSGWEGGTMCSPGASARTTGA